MLINYQDINMDNKKAGLIIIVASAISFMIFNFATLSPFGIIYAIPSLLVGLFSYFISKSDLRLIGTLAILSSLIGPALVVATYSISLFELHIVTFQAPIIIAGAIVIILAKKS
jgi:peptidoglycan/LPS O-acetylase OafA/YrhL